MNFIVNRVRKETSSDGTHRHLEGVCTTANLHYTRKAVVDSIKAGDHWTTVGGGVIRPINKCPVARCMATPYITTRPDESLDNNLENLPLC
jgi:hypothetical protein